LTRLSNVHFTFPWAKIQINQAEDQSWAMMSKEVRIIRGQKEKFLILKMFRQEKYQM